MAHVLQLAASVYYAQALIRNADVPHFDALSPSEKHRYVHLAEVALIAAEPSPYLQVAIGLSRAEGARVVGRISPSTPWGDPTPLPIDSRD
jgi:hypothetical protein